ncbi:right-handed parallel beta-helix repeat-containing protein [Halosolutus gelatinilyticus]|uniref:right-handed parallel beta-helix repeat-containing protein n=1 Tax=Halosolutus gelatinilyticus TaxID=2931975 RepID=UPI001FF5B105|nr:right-handed parallel beta-helix repeat-containing protein [Halosolutus gelatinilyticus]
MWTTESGEDGLLHRRSYLKIAGAAALGTALTGTAAASDHETVTVPEDERKVVEVGDSELLENVTYDVTAAGAGVTIVANGTDWTIRNIAVDGAVDMGDHTIIGAADTGGGTSRIENVWLGDGCLREKGGATGIWVDPDHEGRLEIERVNVQEMSDNGLYCSAPGTDWGSGGTVAVRDCYAANNRISQYRLAEGTVENCVASVTDDREHRHGRGVWAWSPGPVEVRDCHFDMNGNHYSFVAGANDEGSRIDVFDTEWDDEFHGGWRTIADGTVNFEGGNGNDPRNFVPDGCPTSAAEAVCAEEEPKDSEGDEPESESPSVDDYRNDETGAVETDGFREALGDWERGDIGTSLLIDVFSAWFGG